MDVLRRLFLLLSTWLKSVTAPAPDPRQTFVSAHERQRSLLVKVRQSLAELAQSKERLEAKMVEVQRKLPQLQEEARRDLVAGREDIARLELTRRQVAVVELQALQEHVDGVKLEEHRLSLVEQRLTAQMEAFFARQEILAARYSTAEAQVRISEALTGVTEELDDLGLALRQAEEKTEEMQARAYAIDRLVETGVLQVAAPPLETPTRGQISQLDVAQVVEGQLTALKEELGQSHPPPKGGE